MRGCEERISFPWVLSRRVWEEAILIPQELKLRVEYTRKISVNTNKVHMKTYSCIRAIILTCRL